MPRRSNQRRNIGSAGSAHSVLFHSGQQSMILGPPSLDCTDHAINCGVSPMLIVQIDRPKEIKITARTSYA